MLAGSSGLVGFPGAGGTQRGPGVAAVGLQGGRQQEEEQLRKTPGEVKGKGEACGQPCLGKQ